MRTIFLTLSLLALGGALAAAPQPAGVVTTVSGKVTVFAGGGQSGKDLQLGKQLFAGDRLKTGANGRLALVLTDGTQMKLNYNTDITLRDKDSKGRASARGIGSIRIGLGDLWAKVTKKNSRLEFETPAGVAAVKGTEPTLSVDADGNLCVRLKEGMMELMNEMGSMKLAELEMACLKKGGPIGDSLRQKWDGVSGSFSQDFDKAQSADVLIRYVDGKGETKEMKVRYARPAKN